MTIDFSTIGINFGSTGGSCNIEPRTEYTITQNGNYPISPDEEYDAMEGVDVIVSVPLPNIQSTKYFEKNITEGGMYVIKPDEGYDGMESVIATLSVPNTQDTRQVTLEQTESGSTIITPSTGYDNMSRVSLTVNVPTEEKSATYTANGEYEITKSDDKAGMTKATVTVNVPTTNVQDMKIVNQEVNTSGLYVFSPDEGYDAMKVVRANLTIQIDLSTGISFAYSKIGSYPYPTTFPYSFTGSRANMDHMFDNCTNLGQIDPSYLVDRNTTSIKYFFNECINMVGDLDLTSWRVDDVEYMSGTFNNCDRLTSINVSGWNTENVKDMNTMFNNTTITTLDLTSFSTKGLLLDFYNSGTFLNNSIVNFFISSKWFENPYLTTYNFSHLKKWTGAESIAAFVEAIPQLEDGTSKTVTFSEATKNALTEEQKTTITNKGWTIS